MDRVPGKKPVTVQIQDRDGRYLGEFKFDQFPRKSFIDLAVRTRVTFSGEQVASAGADEVNRFTVVSWNSKDRVLTVKLN